MLVPTGNMRISSAEAHMVAQQLCCARGIARSVSGLDVRRISRCRVASDYVLLSRVHVLPLKLAQRSCYGTALAIQVRCASCKGYGRFEKIGVHEGYIEKSRPVKGAHRLAALNPCPSIKIMLCLTVCSVVQRSCAGTRMRCSRAKLCRSA